MTAEEIVQRVRARLAKQDLDGIRFDVAKENGVWRDGDYWRVVVMPSAQPPKIYAYYEILAEVETDLDEEDHLNILLVPGLPDEEVVTEAA